MLTVLSPNFSGAPVKCVKLWILTSQKFPIMVISILCLDFCHLHQGICKELDYNETSCKKQAFSQEHVKQREKERERSLDKSTVCACEWCVRFPDQRLGSCHVISTPTVTAFGTWAKHGWQDRVCPHEDLVGIQGTVWQITSSEAGCKSIRPQTYSSLVPSVLYITPPYIFKKQEKSRI